MRDWESAGPTTDKPNGSADRSELFRNPALPHACHFFAARVFVPKWLLSERPTFQESANWSSLKSAGALMRDLESAGPTTDKSNGSIDRSGPFRNLGLPQARRARFRP